MTAIAGCADYVDRTALQGLGAILPEDGPPRNGDFLPGTETRTVRGPNPRSFSTRGLGPLRESGAVHMSWATPAFSAVIQAIDYRFAFPSLPDHDGVIMERVKGAALMVIMNRGLSYLSRWRRHMGGCPAGHHESRAVLPVTIGHDP